MSIKSVNTQIRRALADDKLTRAEAEAIVANAEKGPVTTGEARAIADLYEKGEWFMPNTFPVGALPQPRPPQYESEAGAKETLLGFFLEHRVPQGEGYALVKKDIEATLRDVNVYDRPLDGPPAHLKHLHHVFLRDSRPVDGDRLDAYVDTAKRELYVKSTGAGMAGPDTVGPFWYGPVALAEVREVAPADAVAAVNAELKRIHGRLTEELRTEDAISNVALRDDGSVAVVVDPRNRTFSDSQITAAAERLLAEAGLPGVAFELVKAAIEPVPVKALLAQANEELKRIHSRLTEELRTEDAISNLALRDDGSVAVVVDPQNRTFTDSQILAAAERLLADVGLAGVGLELVKAAIEPVPAQVMVDQANAALEKIKSRLTTDIRSDDDISNFSLRPDGAVAVVVRPHAYFSDAEILEAARRLLDAAGLVGVATDLVRPAVDPFFPVG